MQRNLLGCPTVLNDVTNTTKDLPRANSFGSLCVKPGSHQFVNKHHKASTSALSKPISTTKHSTTLKYFDGDAVHEEDPQHVVEYLPDIYSKMRDVEMRDIPNDFDYMKRQKEITPGMRAILNDWIVDVHRKFKLRTETLFLTVDLIDRFLACRDVKRVQLQLTGVTALLLASKFEEIHPPPVQELVLVTDNAYKKEEVLEMELSMLRLLDFKVCRPTSIQFLTRFQSINGCREVDCCLTQFFLEMMLIEYAMIKYSPSHLAATAVLLCNKLCHQNPCWTHDLEVHTGNNESSLEESIFNMFDILKKAENSSLQAVQRKFGTSKYLNVSNHRFTDLSIHC